MSVRVRLHYTIRPSQLADWLDRQSGTWWIVDGDPRLTGEVDFPCPSGELSEALRHHDGEILVHAREPLKGRQGNEEIDSNSLDALPDREEAGGARTFLFSWKDRDDDWLLTEDFPPDLEPIDGDGGH